LIKKNYISICPNPLGIPPTNAMHLLCLLEEISGF